MKKYVGKELSIQVDTGVIIKGMLLNDDDKILTISSDGKLYHIVKNKINCYSIIGESKEEVKEKNTDLGMTVLACENPNQMCPGVMYIRETAKITPTDHKIFMSHCGCHREDCLKKTLGDISKVNKATLVNMLDKNYFGSFPKAQKEK